MCIANLPDELSLVGPASRLASVCPKSIGLWSAILKSRDWKQQPEVTQQASVYLRVTCWPTSHAGMWNAPVHSLVCVTIVPGDVCKCYWTCVRWCRREKEVCAWVDIVIKAPLMHLCSNKLRTWEECKCCDFFFFFFLSLLLNQTSSSVNEQSKQVTHVLCCIWGHQLLLTDLKMPQPVRSVPLADQIHTKLFHPATCLHSNGV